MTIKSMISILLLILIGSLYTSSVSATVLGDCADAGNSVCSDEVKTAGRHKDIDINDPEFNDVVAAECKTACVNKANSLSNYMKIHTNSSGWICTATSSTFTGLSVTHN